MPLRNRAKRVKFLPKLLRLRTKKRHLYRLWKQSRLPADKQKYKTGAEKYRTEARNFSDANETKILNSCDVNLFYKFVNGKLKSNDSIPALKIREKI